MQTSTGIVAGSLFSLTVLTAPVLAKNDSAPKIEETFVTPSCHASQRAADGSWIDIPCQEIGGATVSAKQKTTERAKSEEAR